MVKDLLEWYEVGKGRHSANLLNHGRKVLVGLILAAIVPFSVVALFIYDVLVSVLLIKAVPDWVNVSSVLMLMYGRCTACYASDTIPQRRLVLPKPLRRSTNCIESSYHRLLGMKSVAR